MKVNKLVITPFLGQKPGTSGLRKKTKEFIKEGYIEAYIQSVFNVLDVKGKKFVIGGDGRFHNLNALKIIVKVAIANGADMIYIAKDALISTPAISNFILQHNLDFGVMLSASHNPGGIDGDFGIKINTANGAPADTSITDKVFEETLKIQEYYTIDEFSLDISQEKEINILNTKIFIKNGVLDYANKMEEIFDFNRIRDLLHNQNFKIVFNGFCGVTGIFAKEILVIGSVWLNRIC